MIEDLPEHLSTVLLTSTQQVDDEEEEGMRHIEALLDKMDGDKREPC